MKKPILKGGICVIMFLATGIVTSCQKSHTHPDTISSTYTVSTFAGTGTAGFSNGPGTTAEFNSPMGIATDGGGNVYVTDMLNQMIRKITPGGVVSTLSGSGNAGDADGSGSRASFTDPTGITVDSLGRVYVEDSEGNNNIRIIHEDGTVMTLASGPGSIVNYGGLAGIVVNSSGDVYYSDTGDFIIRKLTSTDTLKTFAGKGSAGYVDAKGTAAAFNIPYGLTLDASGNVYVADYGNNAIRKISPDGTVSTFASVDKPWGVAFDISGNLYVTSAGLYVIKITPDGVKTVIAGTADGGSANGIGSKASFRGIYGIAVDRSGNIYVADQLNNLVRKIALQ